jgi:hypothetical protein
MNEKCRYLFSNNDTINLASKNSSEENHWHDFLKIAFINPSMINNAYSESKDLDPRFNYLDFLDTLEKEIHLFIDQYRKLNYRLNAREISKRIKDISDDYKARSDELSKVLAKEIDLKPQLWAIVISLISTPVVIQFVNEITKWIATTFLQIPVEVLPKIPPDVISQIASTVPP